MITRIIKRDGREVPFNIEKIAKAIFKAQESLRCADYDKAMDLACKVAEDIDIQFQNSTELPSVEDIQNSVEKILNESGNIRVAKEYSEYRKERTKIRDMSSTLMNTYKDLTFKSAKENNLARENGNINGDTSMGTMLRYGSEGAKHFNQLFVLDPEVAKAHKDGDIHIHDLDFMMLTTTCTQIDLTKLFENGFSTGHGKLRKPNSIQSYSALACIAIQSNQNDQHGGQSIPLFDYAMADGVRISYKKIFKDNFIKVFEIINDENAENKYEEFNKVNESIISLSNEKVLTEALSELFGSYNAEKIISFTHKQIEKETHQAMEALIANLNTMHSRAGAQIPFSSLNYGTDTSAEGRLVIKQLLIATDEGLGNGETPIFPIQIFKVKEGVNYNKEDPNYDLFKLACKVSAKRLFPNFSFLDAPFNAQFYKEGNIHTEIAYMGAVTGEDIITIRYNNIIETIPFKEAYDKYNSLTNVEILDRGNFVKILAWQNYPDGEDWYDVKFSDGRYIRMTSDHPLPTQRGRVMCKDLQIGDIIPKSNYNFNLNYTPSINPWLIGVLCCDGNKDAVISLGMDEYDITNEIIKLAGETIKEQHSEENGNLKSERHLPSDFLTWDYESRMHLLAGIIDADGYFDNERGCYAQIDSTNKSLAIEECLLAESLGFNAKLYKNTYDKENDIRYSVQFRVIKDIPVISQKKKNKFLVLEETNNSDTVSIMEIKFVGATGQRRYDVTTESDRFDVSGINSHNCRTRVIANAYDKENEIVTGRGNLSFTSINLPRIAIDSNGNIDKFFNTLQDKCQLVIRQLLERFEIQANRRVRNYPFLMGQGVWIGSDKLKEDDTVREVLKHGTLTIGFIGLAECLKALIGKHHGESDEAQNLGLEIVGFMRRQADEATKKYGLNFSLIATPAEGLSFRFTRLDKKKYGIIEGITDRDYYTNSFHIPVYYNISATEKIKKEAPYHNLTNGGHITYIELDGNTAINTEAFESIVRCMKESGIGYGAINHPVDHDPVCGFTGIIENKCPCCGRTEDDGKPKFERIRRITGYLVGTLENFNDGKRAEEHDRVKHSVVDIDDVDSL